MYDQNRTTFYGRHARLVNALFILALFVGFTVYYRQTHAAAVTYDFEDSCVTLTGTSGSPAPVRILFSDIISVSSASEPELGDFVEGLDDERCCFGTWKNTAYGTYTLCAYPGVTEYIIIGTKNGYIVCNYEDNDATRSLCDAFVSYLDELGYDAAAGRP